MTLKKKYIVTNPRGVKSGVPILGYNDGRDFYEGDVFIPSKTAKAENIKKLLDQGLIVEVEGG